MTMLILMFLALTPAARGAGDTSATGQATDSLNHYRWHDGKTLLVMGKGWTDTASFYNRLPARAKALVPEMVWNYSRQASGLSLLFKTDAEFFLVRGSVTQDTRGGGQSVDLYTRNDAGQWRWVMTNNFFPTANPEIKFPGGKGRPCMLYLPWVNGVESIEIGIPAGATLSQPDEQAGERRKPIVFYGTSIVQGAGASRPGMTSTAMVGRRLNVPILNLGFCGCGRMELALAKLLGELDPALYVVDCLPNMNGEMVAQRAEPFVKALRAARPQVPILLVGDGYRPYYDKLKKAGIANLHLLATPYFDIIGEDGVDDGIHPNDLGMFRLAEAYIKAVAPLLQ